MFETDKNEFCCYNTRWNLNIIAMSTRPKPNAMLETAQMAPSVLCKRSNPLTDRPFQDRKQSSLAVKAVNSLHN